MILLEKKLKELSPDLQKEALDFIDFLIENKMKIKKNHKRPFGLCKGEIIIHDDFYKPMSKEELKEWGIS